MSALSAEGSERGSRSLATRLQYHGGDSVEGEGSQAVRVLASVIVEQDGLGKIWCDEAAIVTIRFDLVTERSAAQADTKAAGSDRGSRHEEVPTTAIDVVLTKSLFDSPSCLFSSHLHDCTHHSAAIRAAPSSHVHCSYSYTRYVFSPALFRNGA